MDELCDEFARLFAKVNWTQARVASELGVHPSVITRYLKGATRPSITVLRLFANLIGEAVLIPGEPKQRTPGKYGPRWLQDWQEEALEAMQRIDPKARRAFIAALRAMLDSLGRSTPESKNPNPGHSPESSVVDEALKRIVHQEVVQVFAEEKKDPRPSGKSKRTPPDGPPVSKVEPD